MQDLEAGASNRAGSFDLWVVGAVLAGAFALYLAGTAGIIGRYNDDSFYALAARSLAEGGLAGLETMRSDPSRFPIGFSAFLAALWILAGRDFSAVPVWEVSVGVLSATFFLGSYALLTRVWGVNRWAAGAAVVLLAFHPVTVKYSGAVMSDLPCAALMAGAIGLCEWARRRAAGGGAAPWLLPLAAGAALGISFITRYAALVLVVAAIATFLRDQRWRAAVLCGLGAAATAAPWVWWVVQHRAYGYADEYAKSAGTRSYGESLLDSASWLVFEAMPGLLLPRPFLLGIETWDPVAMPFGPTALVALVLSAFVLVGCVRPSLGIRSTGPVTEAPAPGAPASRRLHEARRDRRLPALFALGTVLLVLLWSGRFPKLGWDLQIRLLLPVAPILLAFSFDWLAAQAARLPRERRAALALVAVLLAGWAAFADARIAAAQIERTRHQSRDFLRGLLAARSYLANVPPDLRVGTLYTTQASFYIPRRFEAVRPSIAGLREARDRGIRLILATPYFVGDKDVMRESVNVLTETRPPEARVLFAPTENVAVVHLPAKPVKRPGDP